MQMMKMQTFVPFVPLCSSLQEQGFLACTSRFSGIYPPLFLCSLYIYIYIRGAKHTLQCKQVAFFSFREALAGRYITGTNGTNANERINTMLIKDFSTAPKKGTRGTNGTEQCKKGIYKHLTLSSKHGIIAL